MKSRWTGNHQGEITIDRTLRNFLSAGSFKGLTWPRKLFIHFMFSKFMSTLSHEHHEEGQGGQETPWALGSSHRQGSMRALISSSRAPLSPAAGSGAGGWRSVNALGPAATTCVSELHAARNKLGSSPLLRVGGSFKLPTQFMGLLSSLISHSSSWPSWRSH